MIPEQNIYVNRLNFEKTYVQMAYKKYLIKIDILDSQSLMQKKKKNRSSIKKAAMIVADIKKNETYAYLNFY